MPIESLNVRSIFDHALDLASEEERKAYLDEVCATAPEIRHKVEALLNAYADAGSFLQEPAIDRRQTNAISPAVETIGSQIGPYKLLQQIGDGGMGTVFMAEQTEPIERKVALKVIKPGMDSRQVIARFEAERQALAMMDHVNIARVLDAGTTESGLPYFVMELVHGVPITKYCDDNRLTPRERLELFVPVCQAIQHAHQKGIIHRDIKPSNVMITLYDGKPVPKVIDFGVAKATEQRLTERTLFTQYGTMVGTLEYMSPEQAEMSALGADTRSDIYSLGVLLYELLTGGTPLSNKRMKEAAYAEILRMIQQEEPPKPSTRLSESGEALASISAQRHMEPAKLTKLMRGELDWIVMKTLEKDRNRRYDTANGLAQDIGHYLADEPVQACPPSAAYRFRKFARRNKAALITTTAVAAALVLGTLVSTWQAVRATTAEREQTLLRQKADEARAQTDVQRKRAEGVNAFFTEEVFGLADPKRFNRAGITLLEALDMAASKINQRFPDDPELRAFIHDRFGEIYYGIDQPRKAVEQSRRAVELRLAISGEKDPRTLQSRFKLGKALFSASQWSEARRVLESVMADQSEILGPAHPDTLHSASMLIVVLMEMRAALPPKQQDDTELKLAQKAYAQALAAFGPQHYSTLEVQSALAWVLRWRGESALAFEHAKAAALGLRQIRASDDVPSMFATYNYGLCLMNLQRFDEAVAELDALLKIRYQVLGRIHFDSLWTASHLAEALRCAGKTSQALEVIDDVCAHLPEIQATKDIHSAAALFFFAEQIIALKRYDQAAKVLAIVDAMYSRASEEEMGEPAYVSSLDRRAELLATSPQPELRNGARAIELATMACEASHYNNPQAIAVLGRVCKEYRDLPAASKWFRKSLELQRAAIAQSPADVELQLSLAESLRDMGELDEAIKVCTGILSRKPDYDAALSVRGWLYGKRDEQEKSAADFTKFIELQPTRAEGWTGRAFAYFHQEHWEKAIADFSKAIELAPQVHTNWLHRGHSYSALAQWDKAAADFTKVIEGWPHDQGGWFFRGCAYAQSNQPEKAISDLRQAIAEGFKDIEHLKNEPKLDPLRSNEEFKKLLAAMEAEQR